MAGRIVGAGVNVAGADRGADRAHGGRGGALGGSVGEVGGDCQRIGGQGGVRDREHDRQGRGEPVAPSGRGLLRDRSVPGGAAGGAYSEPMGDHPGDHHAIRGLPSGRGDVAWVAGLQRTSAGRLRPRHLRCRLPHAGGRHHRGVAVDHEDERTGLHALLLHRFRHHLERDGRDRHRARRRAGGGARQRNRRRSAPGLRQRPRQSHDRGSGREPLPEGCARRRRVDAWPATVHGSPSGSSR